MTITHDNCRLTYDRQANRWQMLTASGAYPMHCGEVVRILVNGVYIDGRLELDTDWFIVFSDTRFTLHQRTVYSVLPD